MAEIMPWKEIAEHYDDTLLVGNGGSIAIDGRFAYGSLKEAANNAGLITASIQRVFDYLETEDFELVMSLMWHASHVNRALGVTEQATQEAYGEVKTALVETVRNNHADYETVSPHLATLAEFMSRFKTVLSLNYDLIVYWAMLEGNRVKNGNWFKDCFTDGRVFDEDWRRLRQPYRVSGATLVFYPHGNLALASHLTRDDEKIVRETDFEQLLDRVLETWDEGNAVPLFVSEGTSQQKQTAIARSGYLSEVSRDVLRSLDGSLVIYGWSLSTSDSHIVRELGNAKIDRVAVSVHVGERGLEELDQHLSVTRARIARINPGAKVEFFDASSDGCWHRPPLVA